MRLPEKDRVIRDEHKRLYEWDLKEYFAKDRKDFWALLYRNRVEKIVNAVEHFVPKGRLVLDVGCAQASISLLLAEKGYRVIAADINSESLQYARMKYESADCAFVVLSAERLPFKAKFDAIVLGEFLEHVSHPDGILSFYGDYLEENGIIVITTPNGSAPHNWRFQSYAKLRKELEKANINITEFGPERSHHVFNFRYSELKKLLLECGYDILVQDYVNSYFINPSNLHKSLPYPKIREINDTISRMRLLRKYLTFSLFFVAGRGQNVCRK